MKNKLFQAIFLSLALVTFFSCEEAEDNTYKDQPFVAFDIVSSTMREDSGTTLRIPVTIATSEVSSATEVTFSVSSADATASDYQVTSTTISIPAGEATGYVEISPVNNSVFEGNKTLTVTLTGNNKNLFLGFPGAGNSSTHAITLIEDDCILPAIDVSYTEATDGCQGDGSGGCNANGSFTFPWGVTVGITEVSNGKYTIDDITMGLYAAYEGDASVKNSATFTLNCENVISIIQAESPDTVYPGDSFFGTGSYDPATETVTLNWSNTWGDQGSTVLTPM